MTHTDLAVEVKNLTIQFPGGQLQGGQLQGGRAPALEKFSLALSRSGRIAIVGESGSGKSLAGYSLARLEPENAALTAEKLYVDGVDMLVASQPTLEKVRGRVISYIFQEPSAAFSPTRRLGDQIGDVLRAVHNIDGKSVKAEARRMLDSVEIRDPVNALLRRPFELSGGMLQRALIALAFVGKPKAVIADEITTAIDASARRTVLELLRKQASEHNAGVLFISHDLGAVRSFAAEIIVLYQGRILESGPTREVLERPAHPYTEMLLAARPENAPPRKPLNTRHESLEVFNDAGCNFRNRCPFAEQKCTQAQIMHAFEGTRQSRCWRSQ